MARSAPALSPARATTSAAARTRWRTSPAGGGPTRTSANPTRKRPPAGPGTTPPRAWGATTRAPAPTGSDEFRGGTGFDGASYANRTATTSTHNEAVTITQDGVANDGRNGETDNVHPDVEDVTGTQNPDSITGGTGADTLHGGAG